MPWSWPRIGDPSSASFPDSGGKGGVLASNGADWERVGPGSDGQVVGYDSALPGGVGPITIEGPLSSASLYAGDFDDLVTEGAHRGDGTNANSPAGWTGSTYVIVVRIADGGSTYLLQLAFSGDAVQYAQRRSNDGGTSWTAWTVVTETTTTIKTKRPLRTINGSSLEGSGDIEVNALANPTNNRISGDWDSVVDAGVYRGSGTPTNSPAGYGGNSFMIVITEEGSSPTGVLQISVDGSGAGYASRRSNDNGSTWSNWFVVSGSNTGDETTTTIKTKRPIRTINGNSLEGSGNISFGLVGSAFFLNNDFSTNFSFGTSHNLSNDLTFEFDYTPGAAGRRLDVLVMFDYSFSGWGGDEFLAELSETTTTTQMSEVREPFADASGGGSRGASLSPILGSIETTSTNQVTFEVRISKLSGDDNITLRSARAVVYEHA